MHRSPRVLAGANLLSQPSSQDGMAMALRRAHVFHSLLSERPSRNATWGIGGVQPAKIVNSE